MRRRKQMSYGPMGVYWMRVLRSRLVENNFLTSSFWKSAEIFGKGTNIFSEQIYSVNKYIQ